VARHPAHLGGHRGSSERPLRHAGRRDPRRSSGGSHRGPHPSHRAARGEFGQGLRPGRGDQAHALHRLATATPDSITTLQNLAKGISGALVRLRELTEARNAEEPVLQPRRLPEPFTVDEKMRAGVLPTRANADYSPFGQGS